MPGRVVADQYFNHIILLFIGGFTVALEMEKWDLHWKIALLTLILFGSGPRGILC